MKDNLELGRAKKARRKAAKTQSERFRNGEYPDWERQLETLRSEEVREKARTTHSGEGHWNWIKDRSKLKKSRFNCSERLGGIKFWRTSVFKRDNYTCQHCGQYGGKLNAHHIKPWKDYKELRFDIDNGATLCEKDHKKIHRKR